MVFYAKVLCVFWFRGLVESNLVSIGRWRDEKMRVRGDEGRKAHRRIKPRVYTSMKSSYQDICHNRHDYTNTQIHQYSNLRKEPSQRTDQVYTNLGN